MYRLFFPVSCNIFLSNFPFLSWQCNIFSVFVEGRKLFWDAKNVSGYATTNVAALSTGLPLVMPGPKATTFFCTICNREFSNVYYKRHMIVHANSRPYVCDVCGKRFNERSNMMKHKQRLHGPWMKKKRLGTKNLSNALRF